MIPSSMEMVDPERERQRLREEYSRMIDGELEQIAADGFDLTDLASGVLREEMSRRGLSLQPGPRLSSTPMSKAEVLRGQSQNLCVVRRFASFSEALIAKTCLDGSGIESVLADQNVLGANPFLSNALGGARLFVNEADLEQATKLLDEPIPEEFEIQGVGKYVQPRCPQCFSMDITFGELSNAAKVSLPLGLPLPLLRDKWLCHNCGCRWTDSKEE
jgi:Putative prokaryotic signal transducing protein